MLPIPNRGLVPFGGVVRDRRSHPVEVTAAEAAVVERAVRSTEGHSLSPVLLGYLVGPVALCILMVFRHFGLVARLPVWSYLAVIFGAGILAVLVEPWHSAPAGSLRLHLRLGMHVTTVTLVIYMSGWGPALGMAYAFVALEELQQWGARMWRPVMCWSMFNILVAQSLLWWGLIPSFLSRGQAETVGVLEAIVLAMVIRMAGATGEKKDRAEALLAHQALHDLLTGLPNRGYFHDRANESLDESAVRGTYCAVMLFDLDRFKEINDTMGHQYGDRVLVEIGPRVKTVLRTGDILARLGGDEFCVLLPHIGGRRDAVRVAERIIEVLEVPFEIDGINLGIEASCGISLAPDDGDSSHLLLRRADVAMYVAKESQSSVVVYNDELDVNTPAHLALLGDLRHAVAREEFVLHYQPKAEMATKRILGVEALIRWHHPTLGLLYPDQFIPEAERTGLIEPMTVWVLDEALRQCRQWLDHALAAGAPPLSVAVNLSTRSLLDSSLPAVVGDALARWDVPASLLELEITETIIMTDPRRARKVLTELAGMGLVLAIDDFGTGYSSLAYLRDLPVNQLKIDRSFVRDMGRAHDDAVIVRSVVDLARNLGLHTVAEGVEDASTWQLLTELGCNSAQGYFLAKPLPADGFESWLAEHESAAMTSAPVGHHRALMTRDGLTTVPH
jgi:diguanylate cyclase (GGDEF)-like protein